ncbi:hypothetical protein PMAYCL1PPCAC_21957, partial [Pristionchus mayeri]
NRSMDGAKDKKEKLLLPAESLNRCPWFPACNKNDQYHLSTYHHPTEICPYFGTADCFGVYCFYTHPKCPQGKHCTGLLCTYEHSSCHPTLLRRLRASEGSEEEVVPHPVNELTASNPRDNIKTKRCIYFPKCRRSDEECDFIHPRLECKRFPSCPGVYCRLLHLVCPNDGNCPNIECAYEHKVTLPSLRRMHYAKMNGTSKSSQPVRQRSASRRPESSRGEQREAHRERGV